MKKLLLIFIAVGLILAGAGFWYWQRNIYSKETLKLEIIGPSEASIFQEIEYTIKYKNNGNITLEEPRLIFEFPEYSMASQEDIDQGKQFSRRIEIGPDKMEDIYPGEEKTMKFKARIFGKEGDVKEAKAWLNYKPKGLSARYESKTTLSTTIKQVSLTLDFDLSSKIEAGRDFDFFINYFSNLDYPVSDLSLKIDYPTGFEFVSSSPKGFQTGEWDLPLLNKAEGGRIDITGRMLGDAGKQRVFSAAIGVWQNNEFIPLKEVSRGTQIAEPQLQVFQRVNGSDSYAANPGDILHYEIFFRNLSSEPFSQLFMVVKLDGKLFDLNSIRTDTGQFGMGDSSIMWDWRKVSALNTLNSGEEGKIDFWINVKSSQTGSSSEKDFVLKDSVEIAQTKNEFEVKVGTKMELSQKVLYNDDAFGNTGPVPPKVGEKTTFTVAWELKNYYSDVKNATVRAVLPENVKLTGKIYPESESSKLTFDSNSRQIVWRVSDGDNLGAGTGISSKAPSIFFQVELTPDASQRMSTAQIIGQATAKGEDQWSNSEVEATASAVNTTLPQDTNISDHSGIIQ